MTFQKINLDRHYSCRLDFNTSSIILKASATIFSTRVRIRIFDQCLSGLLVQQRYFRRQGTRVPGLILPELLLDCVRLPKCIRLCTQLSCMGTTAWTAAHVPVCTHTTFSTKFSTKFKFQYRHVYSSTCDTCIDYSMDHAHGSFESCIQLSRRGILQPLLK